MKHDETRFDAYKVLPKLQSYVAFSYCHFPCLESYIINDSTVIVCFLVLHTISDSA